MIFLPIFRVLVWAVFCLRCKTMNQSGYRSRKVSFVSGRSSPVDFRVDSNTDFGVDFDMVLAEIHQIFSDFLICHKLMIRLTTKCRPFVLNERPKCWDRFTTDIKLKWQLHPRRFTKKTVSSIRTIIILPCGFWLIISFTKITFFLISTSSLANKSKWK